MLAKKKNLAAGLLATAFAAMSLSAQAASVAGASAAISNFSYQLIDLNPADGIAASLTFTSYSSYGTSTGRHNYRALEDTRTTLGTTSVGNNGGRASTAATTTGVSSTATALLPESVFKAVAIYTQAFTLSADTLVIFSADSSMGIEYDAAANLRRPLAEVRMYGEVDFPTTDGQPIYQSSFKEYDYIDALASRNGTLIGALHSMHSAVNGTVNLVAHSYAYWEPTVSPVPEPGAYAMLLAGLGLVGLASRRRRANAR